MDSTLAIVGHDETTDSRGECEVCGCTAETLLPASDGRTMCPDCCTDRESITETTTWSGINPLDPAYAEDTLPMDRSTSADLHARIQARLQA